MNARINAIYQSFKTDDYKRHAKRVVLIANVQSFYLLNNLYYKILEGLKLKWKQKYGDVNDRLEIIYLTPNDKPTDEKFAFLTKLKHGDQIDIVGHYYAGHDEIESDEIIVNNMKKIYKYPYLFLSEIITTNVDKNVLQPSSPNQLPLLINFLACETAKSKMNFFPNSVQSSSIAEKMISHLLQQNLTNVVVRGRLFDIYPIPTKKNKFLKFAFNLFRNDDLKELVADKDLGFHVRNSVPFSMVPKIINDQSYKVDHFIMNNEHDQPVVEKVNRIKKIK